MRLGLVGTLIESILHWRRMDALGDCGMCKEEVSEYRVLLAEELANQRGGAV